MSCGIQSDASDKSQFNAWLGSYNSSSNYFSRFELRQRVVSFIEFERSRYYGSYHSLLRKGNKLNQIGVLARIGTYYLECP